jgi:hypothetical protein
MQLGCLSLYTSERERGYAALVSEEKWFSMEMQWDWYNERFVHFRVRSCLTERREIGSR